MFVHEIFYKLYFRASLSAAMANGVIYASSWKEKVIQWTATDEESNIAHSDISAVDIMGNQILHNISISFTKSANKSIAYVATLQTIDTGELTVLL